MLPDRRHSYLFLRTLRQTSKKVQAALNSLQMASDSNERLQGDDASLVQDLEETATTTDDYAWLLPPPWMRSTAVLSLVVVATLTAVAGFIYLIIYFKSIKPLTARTSRYCRSKVPHHHHKNPEEEVGQRMRSTHPFFRRT